MNIPSKTLFKTLNLIKFKKRINYLATKKANKIRIPKLLKNFPYTSSLIIDDNLVYTAGTLNKSEKKHVIYFHGGGYSFKASRGHFQLMRNIINETGSFLSFMDYPLAPEYSAADVMDWSLKSYEQLVAKYPDHTFILMGDSAGGGLALSLSILIRDSGIKKPELVILYSPWLDIGLSNKGIDELETRDYILDKDNLKEIGEIYKGELEADNPLVSPIYGDLNNLGRIAIFYGTEEILYPDCQQICNMKKLEGTIFSSFVYEKMQHDWVILPIEEAKKALKETVKIIKEIRE